MVVDDGNTVVLGGLIEDSLSDNTQAVPLLGRIPLLGWLFKSNEKRKTKTNLMVFLRPIIVRSADDSYSFTHDRYEHMRAAEKTVSQKTLAAAGRFQTDGAGAGARETITGRNPVGQDLRAAQRARLDAARSDWNAITQIE